MRFSLNWASVTFIFSILFVLGAFASVGFAILPPLPKFEVNMIVTTTLGTLVCGITLGKFLLFRYSIRIRECVVETVNDVKHKFNICVNR